MTLLALLISSRAQADDSNPLDILARTFSPEFAAAQARLDNVEGHKPIARPPAARCNSLGYHSRAAASPTQIRWVQVDLGESQLLDHVVLVPAIGPDGAGAGYHFPPRFQVELSDEPTFMAGSTVAEIDVDPAAAAHPVIVAVDRRTARYIRVTALRLAESDGRYFFALGELLALCGNRNLAAGRPVTASDSIENPPVWGMQYLVDGQGIVGPPLLSLRSAANGYHAEISPVPDVVKWVQVDLGETAPLDEVRLVPARPIDFPDRAGFGFPRRFRIEAATEPNFRSPCVLLDAAADDYPNPGDGLVVVPARQVKARYVRVTATRLWERTGDFAFALAELQIYSRGLNVSLHKPVTSLDSIERGLWSRQFLVDGFASQYKVAEWPQWVESEHQWVEWSENSQLARSAWEKTRVHAYNQLVYGGVLFLTVSLLATGGLVWRVRAVRRREAERLRERIARDLHDEVGSNLGGILLLAQAGDARDLPEIQRLAAETAAALRDLVWLVRGGPETLADLFVKLRECAALMLKGIDYAFEAPDGDGAALLNPKVKRHVFLAFKEMLANVVRHAAARRASIRLYRDRRWLILEVHDDGAGFDPDHPCAGTGLRNLRERAKALRGEVVIHSTPGKGSHVRLIGRLW